MQKRQWVYPWKKCLEQQKTEQSGGRSFMIQPTLKLSKKVEIQDRTLSVSQA